MPGQEEVFEVEYKCKNCGNEWTKQYSAHTRVKKRLTKGIVSISNPNSIDERDVERVYCPICELMEYVTVKERRPTDGT